MAVALGCGIGLAWWMYDIGSQFAGFDRGATDRELVQLRDKVKQLEADNGRLRTVQVAADRHSLIDNAAQQDTERALKGLQDENAQLKEQLAFIRGVSSGERGGGVTVSRFKVEPGAAGVYRYQLLLVRAGQQDKVFQGRLQLVVTTQDGGKNVLRTFPADASAKGKFVVSVKSYQKLEGEFQVPPAAVVKSVEARVFGEGSSQPKLSKTFNLS
ncbi:hypothetical protein SKTS_03930 [Sulfurimicrobium lacus]|uniref:Uncharacterized protein n=1 Tax=Sulfurimicrobium lacus TaxID=2715678 RepID=A0A6F8V8Q9_9PROT|nr:DUF6776 family protein [Sulfurimicrobium lacus]BCB25507.1 hypothetical protein SKTS_03930 [Sulfurimicrobium lacus]